MDIFNKLNNKLKIAAKCKHKPTEEEIRHGIAGNLCRCTGYIQIVQAIKAASEQL